MAKQLYANNVKTTLAADINNSVTALTLTSATGFPTIGGTDWHMMHLVQSDGDIEIVKVTARTGTSCTIVRAQEGTSGIAHTASPVTVCSINLTRGALGRFEDGLHTVLANAGASSAPSISFVDDPDTGLYSAIANELGVTVGGAGQWKTTDGTIVPYQDSDVDLGASVKRFKNVYADDFISVSATSQLSFRVWRNVAWAISGESTLRFNDKSGANGWDTGNWFNTDTWTATVQSDGVYLATASAMFDVTAAADTLIVRIKVNGTTAIQNQHDSGSTNGEIVQATGVLKLVAGDTVHVTVWNVDNIDNITGTTEATFFTMTKLN